MLSETIFFLRKRLYTQSEAKKDKCWEKEKNKEVSIALRAHFLLFCSEAYCATATR